VAGCILVAFAAFAAATYFLSGASLTEDSSALARVRLQFFAGKLESVRASAPDGKAVPMVVDGGRLTPRTKLRPGEPITVAVVVRRPGWSSWALGSERHERLTIKAPVAHVRERWLNVPKGRQPLIRFDMPVSAVALAGHSVAAHSASVSVATHQAGGSTTVAAAPRPWERLGAPVRVTWFPKSDQPVVLASPHEGSKIEPLTPLRLTYSRPVSSSDHPSLPVAGKWTQPDTHTLVFHPSGWGAPLASDISAQLPGAVTVDGARKLTWHVGGASYLRLQQLLAQEGYLPVTWTPSGTDVARTRTAELAAATSPPDGKFTWRYPNTPHELVSLWQTGVPNEVMQGAVMMFEDDHDLDVDGIAGPQVWHAVIADAISGKRKTDGYSYVYVHRNVPQLLTLWHNGQTVLTSPGNTGVPAAPTALGTWPVFEHIPVGTMSGNNPDGSHYNDPGIRWISYFHGGEALHAFNRASFGTPQSLGCVELPLAAAQQVWPYTPIGTLVTIED
jgi:peptidoglycan hydrolase-like protein with peptidoglycan-binding domain